MCAVLYVPGAFFVRFLEMVVAASPVAWCPYQRLDQVDAPGAKEDNKKSKKPQARKDWWTGSDYNGRQYTTLDTGDEVSEADVLMNKAANLRIRPLVTCTLSHAINC